MLCSIISKAAEKLVKFVLCGSSIAPILWNEGACRHSGTDLMLVHCPNAVKVDLEQRVQEFYPKTQDLKLAYSSCGFFAKFCFFFNNGVT